MAHVGALRARTQVCGHPTGVHYQPRMLRRHQCRPRCAQEQQQAVVVTEQNGLPATFTRYTAVLKKPLGVVLEQDKTGNIYVVEVRPEGSAALGGVKVGDQLLATSGVVYNKELDYGGAKVKGGQEIIRLAVLGETFKTVSAAIGSHPGHIPVTMEFQRRE